MENQEKNMTPPENNENVKDVLVEGLEEERVDDNFANLNWFGQMLWKVKEKFTGRDVKVIGNAGGEGSATIALVATATGLTEAVVLNMDSRDISNIGELARPFLSGGKA